MLEADVMIGSLVEHFKRLYSGSNNSDDDNSGNSSSNGSSESNSGSDSEKS